MLGSRSAQRVRRDPDGTASSLEKAEVLRPNRVGVFPPRLLIRVLNNLLGKVFLNFKLSQSCHLLYAFALYCNEITYI